MSVGSFESTFAAKALKPTLYRRVKAWWSRFKEKHLPHRLYCDQGVHLDGYWTVRAVNPDGSIAWEEQIHNMTTNAGLNYIIGAGLAGTPSAITTWYLGLIDNSGFSSLSAADTMASHAGWSESVAYSESVRQTWTPGSVSGQQVSNTSSVAAFTINASVTVQGAFLVSNSTKSGTSGTLFATGAFSTTQSLVSSQSLQVVYTLTGTGS